MQLITGKVLSCENGGQVACRSNRTKSRILLIWLNKADPWLTFLLWGPSLSFRRLGNKGTHVGDSSETKVLIMFTALKSPRAGLPLTWCKHLTAAQKDLSFHAPPLMSSKTTACVSMVSSSHLNHDGRQLACPVTPQKRSSWFKGCISDFAFLFCN